MTYALIVESEMTRSGVSGNPIMTREGEKFWVCDEPDGWVEATSSRFNSTSQIPGRIKVFKSMEKAAEFAKRWSGHPWWCRPNGKYEIVKIRPKFVTHIQGYELDG